MTIEVTHGAIELGIVVGEIEPMLRFYRDTLGMTYLNEQPVGPGGSMHRLTCGDSIIKLVVPPEPPPAQTPRGTRAQTGIRYYSIHVANLEELVRRCEEAGCEFHVPLKEFRPGSWYAQVFDPDGNVVALVREGLPPDVTTSP